eukprot:TRINITY_DN5428_c0_g1_i5.p2 TRINITY_DN5428_c0_g1~~TRINITY_DN5428_c0_g1_i5.p2  ORF type:complete len:140 (-),score=39.08 TRINITY_DN5428_c0_g1_i5:158-577(-)
MEKAHPAAAAEVRLVVCLWNSSTPPQRLLQQSTPRRVAVPSPPPKVDTLASSKVAREQALAMMAVSAEAAKRPPRSAASKAKAKAAAALRKGKRGKQGVSASILKPSKKAAGDKSKGALKRGMPKKRPAAAAVSGLDID